MTIVTTRRRRAVGTVPPTGAWQTYTDVHLDVPLDAASRLSGFNATAEGWNDQITYIQMEAKCAVAPRA